MKYLKFIVLLLLFYNINTISIAQQNSFWGTTSTGGTSNNGTIFKTDTNGNNFTSVHTFKEIDGKSPLNTKLIKASNGKIYGTTSRGGFYNDGVIFEYDYQLKKYSTLHHFDGALLGKNPSGGLIEASNGKLYGMTWMGGTSGDGILFEFDLTSNVMTKKVDFNSTLGAKPNGALIEANNGKLYGLTTEGGILDRGVLFEYDYINDVFTKKVDFDIFFGEWPSGSMTEATNGKLYGITRAGGAFSFGTLFEYSIPADTLVTLEDFVGVSNGAYPFEGPIQAANGKLYGLTSSGGGNNQGVLYEYNIQTSNFTRSVDITSITGGGPRGSLVETTNGHLYGMADNGGSNGDGIIFQYNYNLNTLTHKFDFDDRLFGANPSGTLTKISNNELMSCTVGGGKKLYGVLFEYDIVIDSCEKLIDFEGNVNPLNPEGSITYADNGMLYGVTFEGGKFDTGTLYELDPKSNELSIKYESLNSYRGFYPLSDLINVQGSLYGFSLLSPDSNTLTLYKYNYWLDTMQFIQSFGMVGSFTKRKHSLFLHSNGKIYGIGKGNNSSIQTLFEYDIPTNMLTELHSFQTTGSSLFISEGPGGIIYGVNSESGRPGNGYLFKFDLTTNIFNIFHTFNGVDGRTPVGELVSDNNGSLYGVTTFGGQNNDGVIFRYYLNLNLYSRVINFDNTQGAWPDDGLAELNSGKLYGTTRRGGLNDEGVLYEFDFNTYSYTVKHHFDGIVSGSFPRGKLTKASPCITIRSAIAQTSCNSFTSPSGKYIWTNSGIYLDTIKKAGCDSIVTVDLTIKNLNGTVSPLGVTTLASNAFNATYQWLDCNNNYAIIPNETGQLFTATSSGNYAVEVTSTINGCKDTSLCYPITLVGIDENEFDSQIAVFPNPTSDHITIALGAVMSGVTTQVYNVYGKLISESNHQAANQVELELGESDGVYFIHLISDRGERVVKKVVKN